MKLRNILIPDNNFYRLMLRISVPIIIQTFISSAMNLSDVMMVGQMGETAVAAVGLGSQVYFLLYFVLFGISSGSAIFTAQFWGKQDIPNIRKILGICLTFGLMGAGVFTIIGVFFPSVALGIYSNDPAVISMGTPYLRIVAASYLLTAVSFSYSAILRSVEMVRLPMWTNGVSILIKTGLSYILIFGKFGLPAMGIEGAALGTLIARFIECTILLFLTYRLKTPAAASPAELFHFDRELLGKYFKTSIPVAINECLWSLGISTFNLIYAHISTESVAATNIAFSIENLAVVIFVGLSDACGIMVGNQIGAGHEDRAYSYARQFLIIAIIGSLLFGAAMILSAQSVLSLYNIEPDTYTLAYRVLLVSGSVMWVRTSNMFLIVGIMRSGGDTRFGLIMDSSAIWFVGVPFALLGAFVFHLPVYFVYLLSASEEFVKFGIGLWRFFSRRWINNLVKTAPIEAH